FLYLFNVDENEVIEHVNNPSTRILDELNDLHFEKNDKNKDDLNIIQIKPSDFISLPSNTNNNNNLS
ncbi:unnamed protein product, partial [Rotaria sp. Silwood1]